MEPNSIPYQISFQYSFGFHFCGGSIYDETTVISAAHCCANQDASDLRVIVGEHNLFEDDKTETTYEVSKVTIHPNYNGAQKKNDVCLVELTTAIEFSE